MQIPHIWTFWTKRVFPPSTSDIDDTAGCLVKIYLTPSKGPWNVMVAVVDKLLRRRLPWQQQDMRLYLSGMCLQQDLRCHHQEMHWNPFPLVQRDMKLKNTIPLLVAHFYNKADLLCSVSKAAHHAKRWRAIASTTPSSVVSHHAIWCCQRR